MDVDAACQPVMDVTLHDGWVRSGLYLKPSDPVVVNIVAFEVPLPHTGNSFSAISLGRTQHSFKPNG